MGNFVSVLHIKDAAPQKVIQIIFTVAVFTMGLLMAPISSAVANPRTAEEAIQAKYNESGGQSGLGAPLSGLKCNDTAQGGCNRVYGYGVIYWSPNTGAWVSRAGSMRDAWAQTGFEYGRLGYPTSDEINISDGGRYQTYVGGVITWRPNGPPDRKTAVLYSTEGEGAILVKYQKLGGAETRKSFRLPNSRPKMWWC